LILYFNSLMNLKKGDFSDSYFEKLEQHVKDVHNHIKSLIEPPEGTREPVDWTTYFLNNIKVLNNG